MRHCKMEESSRRVVYQYEENAEETAEKLKTYENRNLPAMRKFPHGTSSIPQPLPA